MRLLWADILKISAILGVVLLHVAAPYLVPFENTRAWWIGNIYDSLTRWCVPLFVMISGATILPTAEQIPYPRFLTVRVRRIVIPFLVWSAIYFWYRRHVKGDALSPGDFFHMLLTEPIYYHLWFIYMLIILYLLAPAISAFLKYAPPKHAWYLVLFWFIWASLLPIVDAPLDLETYFTPDMDDYRAMRLSGYFLLGHLLRERCARSGLQLALTAVLFAVGAAATILGTYWLSRARAAFDPLLYKYFSVTVVAMTVALFLFVKSVFNTRRETSERIRMNSPGWLRRIGASVFGVYLMHALVLEMLRDGRLGFTIDHGGAFGVQLPQALGLPVFALSILGLTLAAVMAIRLIPVLRDLMT